VRWRDRAPGIIRLQPKEQAKADRFYGRFYGRANGAVCALSGADGFMVEAAIRPNAMPESA
jgi:hypothetical protein